MKIDKYFKMTVAVVMIVLLCGVMSSCTSTRKTATYDEVMQEYDPNQDGYNYWEDQDDYYYDYMGY